MFDTETLTVVAASASCLAAVEFVLAKAFASVYPKLEAKAHEVSGKLIAAAVTRSSINEKREQFRPVATRGSVLYFASVETRAVNPLYQPALAQPRATLASPFHKERLLGARGIHVAVGAERRRPRRLANVDAKFNRSGGERRGLYPSRERRARAGERPQA